MVNTGERRSDKVGDSLSKRDDADSIGESANSDEFDENDGRQGVIGAHEHAVRTADRRQRRKWRHQRHHQRRQTCKWCHQVVEGQRHDPRPVTHVTNSNLNKHNLVL